MTGPHDPDDGWADLARELGLEQPRPPVADRTTVADAEPDLPYPPADSPSDQFADPELDDGGESDDENETDAPEDADGEPTGEPGEGEPKKKRRRRRRRKKKGAEGGPEPVAVNGQTSVAQTEADDEESDGPELASDEEEVEDEPSEVAADEEDSGPTVEASRELIANWDVPSWEQIVAGLYRPGGR